MPWYQNQSYWWDEQIIHIVSHWNHPDREGKILSVWGYGNCTELDLFQDGIRTGGRDVVIITCSCGDCAGLPIPDATPLVYFNTNGLCRILDTGSDLCDHKSDTDSDRQMKAGLCSLFVQAGSKGGTLRVNAAAAGLELTTLAIKLIETPRRPWIR